MNSINVVIRRFSQGSLQVTIVLYQKVPVTTLCEGGDGSFSEWQNRFQKHNFKFNKLKRIEP